MNEDILRKKLEELLAQSEQAHVGANGSASDAVAERNLRRMLQAAYGHSEDVLTPMVADAFLSSLLNSPNGHHVPTSHTLPATNGHPNGWRKSFKASLKDKVAMMPSAWMAQHGSKRMGLMLALLAFLATIAGAMCFKRWRDDLEVQKYISIVKPLPTRDCLDPIKQIAPGVPPQLPAPLPPGRPVPLNLSPTPR
jgi:hypothetical protein